MRKTIVIVAFALLCASFARAQETTGAVVGTITSQDGQALPGVAVGVTNPGTGLEFVATSSREGRFRFPSLPPAVYTVTAGLEGFQTHQGRVAVALGQTARHDVEMQVGAFSEVVEVTSQVPMLDPTSTVAGLTVSTDQLSSQIPISRDVTRLSLLAPGTLTGTEAFENRLPDSATYTPGQKLVSFGGSSLAENSYLVNGLNVSALSYMMGSTFVPMEFVDQVQVKTGGYEAEFGRSTGGVINLVTKSGTNAFRGGFSVYWSPEALQEQAPNTFVSDSEGNLSVDRHNQEQERQALEANLSLGGPLVRDRLFFFGFVRWTDEENLDIWDTRAQRMENSAPYWGGKIDWTINSSHRLEGTYLSDRTDVDVTANVFDEESLTIGDLLDHGTRSRGGNNLILRYSGLLSDSFLVSAQVGRNDFSRTNQSDLGDSCPRAWDQRPDSWGYVGCWITTYITTDDDRRMAYRVDADWYLGRHALRAGADLETNRSAQAAAFSGGVRYNYLVNGERYEEVPPDTDLVRVRHYYDDGAYDAVSNAVYVQDSWSVTPNLTLNLGIRWESFENQNANGESILAISDQFAPRLGFAWDPGGAGRSKLYGAFGVYHLPMSTSTSSIVGANYYSDDGWYVLEGGINPDGSPEGIGQELEFNIWHEWGVDDPRAMVDSDIDPMSQTELILGFEQLVGANWSLGIRGVAREFNQVIEDVTIDEGLRDVYGVEECVPWCGWYVLTNPGTDFSGWYDLDGDGVLDPIYLTAEQIGIPEAERQYYALELNFNRRLADNWMLQGSYTWSHSYGNYEGLVNSDIAQDLPYWTQTLDVPALLEHGYGNLPNDRRSNLKLFGMYSWQWGLQAGGFFWYRSGRPVNGFGMHPTDELAQAYGNVAFYNGGEPCPRGCGGTTDSIWALDLMLRYDFPAWGGEWNVRIDAFNVFNNDAVTEVDEFAEEDNFEPNPSYMLPNFYQSPRSVRLGFGVSF